MFRIRAKDNNKVSEHSGVLNKLNIQGVKAGSANPQSNFGLIADDLEAISHSDNEDCESVMSNEDKLELEQSVISNIDWEHQYNISELQLTKERLLRQDLEKLMNEQQKKFDLEKQKWQEDIVDKITKEQKALFAEKLKDVQRTIEIERQSKTTAEQEAKAARESEARATADKLQTEQALAVNNAANQTLLLQYKTNYDELFASFRNEQASHKKDNEYWQRQDTHLRKHIYGSVSQIP